MPERVERDLKLLADETTAARYLRTNLYSLYAHDARALLWWCNHDQAGLAHAPYDSWDGGYLTGFEEMTGMRPRARQRRREPAEFALEGEEGRSRFRITGDTKLFLEARGAEVLARETDGNPAFSRIGVGRGTVYLLAVPLEMHAARLPGPYHEPEAQPFWQIYRMVFEGQTRRAVRRRNPFVGVTEHPAADGSRPLVLINYSPDPQTVELELSPGWVAAETLHGPAPASDGTILNLQLPPNEATILRLRPE